MGQQNSISFSIYEWLYSLKVYGMLFNQITASSLVKVDFAGNLMGPTESPVNRAGVCDSWRNPIGTPGR